LEEVLRGLNEILSGEGNLLSGFNSRAMPENDVTTIVLVYMGDLEDFGRLI
jgi:hypothetical protein